MTEQQDTATAAPGAERDNVTPIRDDVERAASLEIVPGQKWWTGPQQAALASIGLADCPDSDRMAFLHLCQATGLDPFRREIYLIGRRVKDGNAWIVRWTPQTGIDGFRHLAEETGVYGGRVGPHWTEDGETWSKVWPKAKGDPVAARCGVIRTDRPHRCRECGGDPGGPTHGVEGHLADGQHVFDDERVTWAVAQWDEYVPMEKKYEGSGDRRQVVGEQPTSMWRKMPSNQLGKCAEAAAIRAAFPRRAAGLYEHAEMDAATQAAREVEESERDKQRRELAHRPWAPAPGGERGVVLDAPTGDAPPAPAPEPTYDRTVLLAELAEQAQAAGKTISQYAVRWVAAHRKNIEDATDAELEAFLAARRGDVAAPVAPDGSDDPGGHGMTVEEISRPSAAPDGAGDDSDREPGEGQQALLGGDDPGDLPIHQFEPTQDDPETCAFGCGMDAGDSVHLG